MSQPDRTSLPIRRETFAGVANRTLHGSQPDWNLIGHPTPPEGAPNVLLVLIDDAGFGNPSTFGGPIRTPNFTRMAAGGLRYNRMHVTALCSPTRAALLTGRNNHAVGFGSIGEFAGGFPGYSAILPRDCAPLPRILRDNGYSTAAFGKWHLTPDGQQGPAGPFDRWPNGWGFDYFYGILGGGSSQYDPVLAENQKIIGTAAEFYDEEHPYYFPDAMADKTVEWLHGVRAQDARKPFFIYYSTGCSHAPHHVAKEWADRYKGQFDQGWDRLREETFARQQELGVIPADAELTPRDEAFPAWEDVPDKLKPFYARQMEVYAGYSENADHNVGRVIDAIEELGELDDTLIIWIWGDNGASMEGTVTGSFNELTMQNGIPLTDEMQLQLTERYGGIDAWSTSMMAPHYGAAWAWAGNTPFQWGKQVGSHLGGTRNPHGRCTGQLASPTQVGCAPQFAPRDRRRTNDPRRGRDPGPEDRRRDRAGADARYLVRRLADRRRCARAPDPAVLRDGRQPRHVQGRLVAGDEDGAHPVGAHAGCPRTLRAGRVGPGRRPRRAVLPAGRLHPGQGPLWRAPGQGARAQGAVLGGGRAVQGAAATRDAVHVLRDTAAAAGAGQVRVPGGRAERDARDDPEDLQPLLRNQADLVVPDGGAEGVIVAEADHLGGFTLYVKDGKLTHTYSMMGVFVFKQVADEALPSGEVTVRMQFEADAAKPATGGDVTLFIDGRPVGKGRMDHTVPIRFTGYAGMDIGRDNGGVVDLQLREREAVRVHRHGEEGGLRPQASPLGRG